MKRTRFGNAKMRGRFFSDGDDASIPGSSVDYAIQCSQCDKMIIQYLSFYNNDNLPNKWAKQIENLPNIK